MTLRKKTLLIIGLTLAGLIVLLYFISQTILLDSYVRLEDQSVRQNVERAVTVLQDQLSVLDSTAATEIENLAETTHLAIAVRRFDDSSLPADFVAARTALSKEQPIFIRPMNAETVAGYTWLEDIYGQPALLLISG